MGVRLAAAFMMVNGNGAISRCITALCRLQLLASTKHAITCHSAICNPSPHHTSLVPHHLPSHLTIPLEAMAERLLGCKYTHPCEISGWTFRAKAGGDGMQGRAHRCIWRGLC